MNQLNHPYHLVNISPWPLATGMGAFAMTSGLVKWFHSFDSMLFFTGINNNHICFDQWWRDVSREATFQGMHSTKVGFGLRWGMILFIISEVFFFVSFFWGFFHSSLSPNIEVGALWPPSEVESFLSALLNTSILLASGVTVTWAHHALMENNFDQCLQGLLFTVLLGLYFSFLQGLEYMEASFTIADSIYGSTFFLATGFHGLHVLIGTIFLMICILRHAKCYFSQHHFGFEAAAWYWHFVDVVWLFLYLSIYWWGE
ncbi:cytochrome c oxidase subunit III (mitochondrion) [Artemia franciscana]|uniref:Cytochrome c oxidase subunit 3 n=1 Tax=Artemia franciscana TaxID=6661 RepID=COX3_ARTSF|nr:cytochrome c oxidase subunit III [Artemia franciscana]Q36309.1 RecName: Full=Cytochrome c oxidase subunit 3; AltName: Full=Cytochrome c oxidase polypeptide III [Artemia franciscana]CAA48810.1 cytochrome-c oxidase [Artemia franciscana]